MERQAAKSKANPGMSQKAEAEIAHRVSNPDRKAWKSVKGDQSLAKHFGI